MSGPLKRPKTFAQKASMIHTAQVCRRENDHLLNVLASSGARQEVILAKLKENEKVIKIGDEELEELIATNYASLIRLINQFTTDANRRTGLIKEGGNRVRSFITNYDYSDVSHFNEDLQGFLADFSTFKERSSL